MMSDKDKPDSQKGYDAEDEIDLLQLLKSLWDNRRTILRTTIAFVGFGTVIAVATPKQYTASTTMVPQLGESTSQLNGLSSIAAITGFSINMTPSNELSPGLYPQIVQSIPYLRELMHEALTLKDFNEQVSLFHYYTEIHKPGVFGIIRKYTIDLPGIIMDFFKRKEQIPTSADTSLISLNEEEKDVIEILSDKISISVNEQEGYVDLSATFIEPLAAAQLAERSQKLLQEYITAFKIRKAQADLDFIEERYQEKKNEFETAQENLARFRDQNRNVSTAMAQTEEERLRSEYQLAYSVYSELAKQLENSKIRVKEDTPVFIAINPVTIPTEKSRPKRLMILIISTIIGGFSGIAVISARKLANYLKTRWKSNS